jgi:GrpB-like predicted nucleotidyltransferase (UPF0157 family)
MASLGLESGVVRLVEYNPEWPALFEAEAHRITAAVHPLRLVIHHTGSTAVPGLAAKPVLDMLAGYQEPALRADYIAAIIAADYRHRGDQEISGRDFFRRGDPRAYHLHLAQVDSEFWHDHLDFRDVLRTDAVLREAYGALKHELAVQHPFDRETYIDAKGPFVRHALRRARSITVVTGAGGYVGQRRRHARPRRTCCTPSTTVSSSRVDRSSRPA